MYSVSNLERICLIHDPGSQIPHIIGLLWLATSQVLRHLLLPETVLQSVLLYVHT